MSGAVGRGVEHFMEPSGCEGALAERGNELFGCLGGERPGPAGRRTLARRGGSSERRDWVSTGFRGEELAEVGVERAALQAAGLVDGEQPLDRAFAALGAAAE